MLTPSRLSGPLGAMRTFELATASCDPEAAERTRHGGASRAGRQAAAIRDRQTRNVDAQPPRRHPLVPLLAHLALGLLHVIDLLQVIVDRAQRHAELERHHGDAVGQAQLLRHAEPDRPVREAEPVLDRACAGGRACRLQSSRSGRPRLPTCCSGSARRSRRSQWSFPHTDGPRRSQCCTRVCAPDRAGCS